LTSALVGGEWSASHPACFAKEERGPATHSIGGVIILADLFLLMILKPSLQLVDFGTYTLILFPCLKIPIPMRLLIEIFVFLGFSGRIVG
jgi:hypothetical protein